MHNRHNPSVFVKCATCFIAINAPEKIHYLINAEAKSKRIKGLLNWSRYFFHIGSASLPVTSLKPWKFLRRDASKLLKPLSGWTPSTEMTSLTSVTAADSQLSRILSDEALSSIIPVMLDSSLFTQTFYNVQIQLIFFSQETNKIVKLLKFLISCSVSFSCLS